MQTKTTIRPGSRSRSRFGPELKTYPLLDRFFQKGVDVFIFFGELAAVSRTGGAVAPDIANEIREHKEKLIAEIKAKTRRPGPGEKVSFNRIIEDRLQSDGTLRPPIGGEWRHKYRPG